MGVKLGKKSEEPIFKQIIGLIPLNLFRKNVQKYQSDKYGSKYFAYDQFVSGIFEQLTTFLKSTLC